MIYIEPGLKRADAGPHVAAVDPEEH